MSLMSNQDKKIVSKVLPSGRLLVRFDNLNEIYKYDDPEFNPKGISIKTHISSNSLSGYYDDNEAYFRDRHILTPKKAKMIKNAQKNLSKDKDFLELVYKAKSTKREYKLNKFGGNLSMPHYAAGAEKVFKKGQPGTKKMTLNLAFQVGTFVNGNYTDSFSRILKTILMCQAMGIYVNIDVFDSDLSGIGGKKSYVICNVAKSHEKLNMKNILASSHQEFFNVTLFNGYSGFDIPNHANMSHNRISGFLSEETIVEDLGEYYDVIGGNMLLEGFDDVQTEMISKILKIGIHANHNR